MITLLSFKEFVLLIKMHKVGVWEDDEFIECIDVCLSYKDNDINIRKTITREEWFSDNPKIEAYKNFYAEYCHDKIITINEE